MKLVTFQPVRGNPRAGALIDGGEIVVDLQAAYRARHKKNARPLASVLAIMQGGTEALDIARTVLAKLPRRSAALFDRASVKLLAPVPYPPQMREFLCFEKHLIQGFEAARDARPTVT